MMAARRELSEALGFDMGHPVAIQVQPEPGHYDPFTDVVVLTMLALRQFVGHEPEPLEPVGRPLRVLRERLRTSAVTDNGSIAALFPTEQDVRSVEAGSTSPVDHMGM